ncbi:unnamed protein product, partial [Rotaria magnacalcarata]
MPVVQQSTGPYIPRHKVAFQQSGSINPAPVIKSMTHKQYTDYNVTPPESTRSVNVNIDEIPEIETK